MIPSKIVATSLQPTVAKQRSAVVMICLSSVSRVYCEERTASRRSCSIVNKAEDPDEDQRRQDHDQKQQYQDQE